ncbi:hypothetical protein [Alkalilimnicola sp. S0819]|uniref:hypothetical protein n=1 Tax=Alkalilimnicola sp. S0819 TaxID=2613922 RepID=UPI001261E3A9|nr:hypothetical protein [Alkalilimnicola sp. S0819]KAB7622863.1 hypothetical protein F3N43_11110 [Alkalilimnicola sp. S0819]MPQ17185.1 hypothetical protein [Alkalilimnicola sp. S0819]
MGAATLVNRLRTAASLLKYRADLWLPAYWRQQRAWRAQSATCRGVVDVMVLVADHFEPARSEGERGVERVREWCERYAAIVSSHRDSDGVAPQHTWFYRYDYPNFDCIRILSEYCYQGLGEIEFHLHHGHDSSEGFRQRLREGVAWFAGAGAMVSAEPDPRHYFAYVAGNWALDNGRRDARYSGVNNELELLREAGCYADFTFPAFGCTAQPHMANCLYYARDHPGPKSYDRGRPLRVGGERWGDLLIFLGPLYIDWRAGHIEYASLEDFTPYHGRRCDYWLAAGVHVLGQPNWRFIKLHTHAMQSRESFLGDQLHRLCADLERRFGRDGYRLHYVTAREAYNIAKAAEAGEQGDAGGFRDYLLPPPANRRVHCNAPYRLHRYGVRGVELEVLAPVRDSRVWLKDGPLARVEGGRLRRLTLNLRQGHVEGLRLEGEGEVVLTYRHPGRPRLASVSERRRLPLRLSRQPPPRASSGSP